MSPRYLVVVRPGGARGADIGAWLRSRRDLKLVFSSERIAAFTNSACPSIHIGEAGCILGFIFNRHAPAGRLVKVTARDAADIRASSGKVLLERSWGGYLATVEEPGGVAVMRDPSGTFPCYYARAQGSVVLASDAGLISEATTVPISVDFEEIGRQLFRAFVPAETTALEGVRELLAGHVLRHSRASCESAPCWSPWDHVDECTAVDAEHLADIIRNCVGAWASTHRRVLLSVSGGLDSSILAACLARTNAEAVCLTMYSQDAIGDERPFARSLCDRLGLSLIEREYRIEDIDITDPLAPHLPRPQDRTQANAYERVHLAVAKDIGADAFMTGNGGDSVFGYSQSAAPVADLFLKRGFTAQIPAALLDVCHQTGCSITDALRQAFRMARSAPAYRVRPETRLLHPDFAASLCDAALDHPWLDAPSNAVPGKAAHIASILRVQPNLEASRGFHLPLISPLMSQPIVEACLGIPSWQWRAGGRDRSVARRAFSTELPPMVLDRRVKGGPSGFAAELLDRFRGAIRDRILGGQLASRGILDKSRVEAILVGQRPVGHADRVRILELVNAEAWIDHWAARRRRAKAP